jgi:hypothetical protein
MQVRGRPDARRNAAMGSMGKHVYVHGGELESWLDDGLFAFDTLTKVWTDIPAEDSPDARYAHTFVGVADARAFMFGGETSLGKSNELLELDVTVDPAVWTDWTEVNETLFLCFASTLM